MLHKIFHLPLNACSCKPRENVQNSFFSPQWGTVDAEIIVSYLIFLLLFFHFFFLFFLSFYPSQVRDVTSQTCCGISRVLFMFGLNLSISPGYCLKHEKRFKCVLIYEGVCLSSGVPNARLTRRLNPVTDYLIVPYHRRDIFSLQLYCPIGISPRENSDCLLLGMPAATEPRYPTYGACCVSEFQ